VDFEVTEKLPVFGVGRSVDETLDEIRREELAAVGTG
jgi:hypothetical protein